MSFLEKEIIKKLYFSERNDIVVIGENTILKQAYLENKEIFDTIINTGDQAWNQKIGQHELKQFIQTLKK